MIYALIFSILAALSYRFWRTRFIPAEVARNAAAIVANGSADDLQRGYHARESWRRVWVGLACCVGPPLPLLFGEGVRGWAAGLGFLAMAALLAGCFARFFTPLLNLAMRLGYKPEYYASPASKSWPDAKAWNYVRAHYEEDAGNEQRQWAANNKLKSIILSAWLWCRVAALLLAGAAGWVALAH